MRINNPDLSPEQLGITTPLLQVVSSSPRLFPLAVEVLAGSPPDMDHGLARQCRDALIAGEALVGLLCLQSGKGKQQIFSEVRNGNLKAAKELVWQV